MTGLALLAMDSAEVRAAKAVPDLADLVVLAAKAAIRTWPNTRAKSEPRSLSVSPSERSEAIMVRS